MFQIPFDKNTKIGYYWTFDKSSIWYAHLLT